MVPPLTRVWTATLSLLALGTLVLTLLGGCCGSDDWKQETFPESGLRFSIPSSWKVSLRRPGQGDPSQGSAGTGDGAVFTALPPLEDAALILIATEKPAAPDLFARRVTDFIPLNGVQFTSPMQPYSLNGTAGFAGEGMGQLPSDGTPVYFRCMVLDVGGKPTIVTLYAEESQRARYEQIFDVIVTRLHPMTFSDQGALLDGTHGRAAPETLALRPELDDGESRRRRRRSLWAQAASWLGVEPWARGEALSTARAALAEALRPQARASAMAL